VARAYAERLDSHPIEGAEAERLTAFTAVGMVGNRQQQVDEQRIAADAGAPIGRRRTLTSERVHRDQDKRRRCDDADREHAAARTIGGVAQAEPRDGTPAMSREDRSRRDTEPDR